MFKQFLNHIDRNCLFTSTDKVLLAVSGGLDSMVMLHLFKEAGFSFGVTHCNFQLRGEESQGDEALVKQTCLAYKVQFHSKQFETGEYANEKGLSIQLAARELRYGFFNELVNQYQYDYIATAHHLDDSIETVFLNLIRGTGIEGVTGIPLKVEKIVRPLLFATRQEIKDYAVSQQLHWREDASNASDKYHRNLLRNKVMPLLKTINPGFESTFNDTLDRLKGTSSLQKNALQQFYTDAASEKDDQLKIDIKKLKAQPYPAVVLWELLKSKGFSYSQGKEIIDHEHQVGKVFYTAFFQLTVDRVDLIVTKRQHFPEADVLLAESSSQGVRGERTLTLKCIRKEDFVLDKSLSLAQVDLDLVRFPLTWRKWQDGDHFIPLGMQQRKKVSDFLVDVKMPLPFKENVTVLESAGQIIWVVGYRVADPFKISENTNQILSIKLD